MKTTSHLLELKFVSLTKKSIGILSSRRASALSAGPPPASRMPSIIRSTSAKARSVRPEIFPIKMALSGHTSRTRMGRLMGRIMSPSSLHSSIRPPIMESTGLPATIM
jgi:hypothetical protein